MLRILTLFIALLALTAQPPLYAQEAGADQRALAKAQYLLRQVSAEKTTLQQQVGDLQKQVDALKQQLQDDKAGAADRQRRLQEKFSAASGAWRQQREQDADALADVKKKLRAELQRSAGLEERLKTQTQNFTLCYGNNKKLYDITVDLLKKYKNKGVMAAIEQKEPFTGIKQVDIENLVQDYRYRMDDLNLGLGGIKSPAETTATGP